MRLRLLSAALAILFFLLAGCRRKEQITFPNLDTAKSHPSQKEATIVVPDAIKGKWKAVKIAVTDKSTAKQVVYTIPIGKAVTIPNTAINIEVEAFLPAFIMEGSTMTSSSNSLKNPGTKVRITEGNALIFKGWLFSLFPTTHSFIHPRYGFALVDVVPTGKN